MENNQDDLVVAMARYKDRMVEFFSYIPGMMLRIGNHIDLPNYTTKEKLFEIASLMSQDLEYDIHDKAYSTFKEYISERTELPYFSN